MRRIISLVLAIVFAMGCVCGLTACNDGSDAPETEVPETNKPETEVPEDDKDNSDDITSDVLRQSIVAEAKDVKVTGAMMAYLLHSNVQQYSTYLSLLGVNTTVSLKKQTCPLLSDTNGTWFDYFVKTTEAQITELLVFAQGAKDAGIELTAEEQKSIDDIMADIEAESKSHGYPDINTYLLAVTGNAITLADVRDCYELNSLANKYYSQFIDSLEVTAEEREAYYIENADSIDHVDIYKYNVLASDFEGETEDQKITLAKACAEELAAINEVGAFADAIRAEIEKVTVQSDDETDEQFAERKEELFAATYNNYTAIAELTSDVKEWVKTANVGDTFVESVDGTTFTVYMLEATPYRKEEKSRNIRHILFSSNNYTTDEKAKEVLDAFIAAGATEAEFERLAKEYSDDTTASVGGLIENVLKGQMVAEFEDWMFDESRQVGDYGIIKSAYGWHLMFYPGEGEFTYWEIVTNKVIVQDKLNAYFAEKSADIEFDQSAVDQINA
ncbi:MAG: peptidylprolyl isomerase [Clostridia bacterium]|nr:peptidylprolyl isomerase [Clostridia bacterium]